MKQQTTAVIERITIDGRTLELLKQADIALEFSAIDAGGGFRDPILDFVYELVVVNGTITEQSVRHIMLNIREPEDKENTVSFAYDGRLKQIDEETFAGMGRLQDGEMTRDMVKFIMRCLR